MHEQHTKRYWLRFEEERLLKARQFANLCLLAIRAEEGETVDERRRFLKAKRAAINAALQHRRFGKRGPPAQHVALKPASLEGRSRDGTNPTWKKVIAEIDEYLTVEEA